MKILIVHSGNNGLTSPYIKEQVESLQKLGVEVNYFTIRKSGIFGYISHIRKYYKKINQYKPDIIHAHFGLSGLFANLQRKVPVVTSFHGSDVHNKRNRKFSKIAYFLSKERIFVSTNLKESFNVNNGVVLTCGVDLKFFHQIQGVDKEDFILFAGNSNIKVKNFPLAKQAVDTYNNFHINKRLELVELKNKTRKEVHILMNKAQVLLITSLYEGSSQVLKEAMACNCPVIAVNVGSVPDLLRGKAGLIVDRNKESIANGIQTVISQKFDEGRKELEKQKIELNDVAKRLIKIYRNLL